MPFCRALKLNWASFASLAFFLLLSASIMEKINENREKSPRVEEFKQTLQSKIPKFRSIFSNTLNEHKSLQSMDRVYRRLGFEFVTGDDWDVLWSHFGPFQKIEHEPFDPIFIKPLKPHQKINHFPGMSCVINKAVMTTSNQDLDFILPTFQFPEDTKRFNAYLKNNPKQKFVEKNDDNRGVKIINVTDINTKMTNKIYQAFVDKPFLIDDRAFDMGIFVLISSINPLRVYRFKNEILLRFCPEPYYPFMASNVDKYVVYESHLHYSELPTFKPFCNSYGSSSKLAFEDHIKKRGHDPKLLQHKIDEVIATLLIKNEKFMGKKFFKDFSTHHFFDLLRFDFILDESMKLYLMEVNLSPNLTPVQQRFEINAITNEQLVHNAVTLVGAGSYLDLKSSDDDQSNLMLSNSKNIAVQPAVCVENKCVSNCNKPECKLCITCVSEENLSHMHQAFREHSKRGGFKRIFPSTRNHVDKALIANLSKVNRISLEWFKAKCEEDEDWC